MQTTPQRGPGTAILVVDDDALITLNAADVLGDLGHTVFEAFSGPQALQILQDNPDVGILITDYAMPGMTGLELAGQARSLRPDLLVLLTTGYADLPEGGHGYMRLEKPYREDELAGRLAELLAPAA